MAADGSNENAALARGVIEDLPETIVAPRTDAIYNCHSYLTKVPVAAITPFIEAFCDRDGVVADIFAGSGMTGLAALQTGRAARLSDISVLGQHIARGYTQRVGEDEFRQAAEKAVAHARSALGDLYQTEREADGSALEMIRTVWSFCYVCPSCEFELVYYDHLDGKGKPPGKCPSCGAAFVKRHWERGPDIPVRVAMDGVEGRQVEQDVTVLDLGRIEAAENDPRLDQVPSKTIDNSREMYSRSGLGKSGLTETAMFFSPRNAIALLELWNAIGAIRSVRTRRKLRFAFTAILPRASKRYQWGPKRPLNAQNQTYYIAPVYYEWNVFDLFKRKVNAAVKADAFLFGGDDLFRPKPLGVSYDLASADDVSHLDDASIDYVFTDPPFGSNIFYSDMNLFHEAWLGRTTNYRSEAVVHTTGKGRQGAHERYEDLLRNSFREAFRILKPGRYLSVVFGNSSGAIWGLVQRAIRDAGFVTAPVHVATLDKGQRSVKGLNSGSEKVVTVDLVMSFQKPQEGTSADVGRPLGNGDTTALIEAAIHELPSDDAGNPSHVYARVLRNAIRQNLMLDDLHLGDVLVALRNAGYSVHPGTGLLRRTG